MDTSPPSARVDAGAAPAGPRARRARLGAALALAACVGLAAVPAATQTDPRAQRGPVDDVDAGRRIYEHGALPSGARLEAIGSGGERLAGAAAACVTCHRTSGLGTVGGGKVVLPVTGDILFRPVWRGRPEMDMARTTGPNARPAYTDESLARVLATGAGPNGLALSDAMPRYTLPEPAFRPLLAYLKSLTSAASPGASASTIRFATVVAGEVTPARRKALLDVIETFVREKNAGTRHEARRRARPPMDMEFEYVRYRDWVLDVWTISGASETWETQLDSLYRQQPVFAMLGGVAEGPWAPIHTFCEARRLPCLFPATDLPAVGAGNFYTTYFTRGMTLEGELLASYLTARPDDAPGPLVQVSRHGRPGAAAAEALARRAPRSRTPIVSVALAPGEAAPPAFWSRLAAAHPGATLAVWLEEADLGGIGALASAQPGPSRVFVSSSLAPGAPNAVPEGLRARVRLVHPYERPDRLDLRLQRTRTWLRSRRIASAADERLQAEAFFALSLVSEALMHNYNFFVREYLLEQVETMGPTMVVSACYPRIDLGVGQRIGSRGGYILGLSALQGAPPDVLSDWIVP